ncbi:MAG: hypothetical protein EOP49_15190 [Sphingobacteriales bacterium]|nr:MAG: hypothetical protein EOP49_15190 [Sphingobacteriales bacterium]
MTMIQNKVHPYVYVGIKSNEIMYNSISPYGIIDVICDYFTLNRASIFIRTRKLSIARPRQIAMYFMYRKKGMTMKLIGEVFGGYDHSTVVHSVRTVENDMDTNPAYANDIRSIETYMLNVINGEDCPSDSK